MKDKIKELISNWAHINISSLIDEDIESLALYISKELNKPLVTVQKETNTKG